MRTNITADMLMAALRSMFYVGVTPPAPQGVSLAHWYAAIKQYDRAICEDTITL